MRYFSLIIILLICSCTNSAYQQHDRLLNWEHELVMEDGAGADGYYTDHKNFIQWYFSADYKQDTLIVTMLHEINSCAEIVADIKIVDDTLYLLSQDIGDVACASVTFDKFTYIVYNPDNMKYKIISKK